MEWLRFMCWACDNECKLSLRGDAEAIPQECPIDNSDNIAPEWELDLESEG